MNTNIDQNMQGYRWITCVNCGLTFAWPEKLEEARRRDGQRFYCPNGYSMSWSKTEADRLREQLEEANRVIGIEVRHKDLAREEKHEMKRQLAAARGQITKLRGRLGLPAGGAR